MDLPLHYDPFASLKLAHGVFLLVVINMLSYFVMSGSKISKHQCSNETLRELSKPKHIGMKISKLYFKLCLFSSTTINWC
jgi:hypothetical protein